MSEYDASIVVLQAISDLGISTTSGIVEEVGKTRRASTPFIAHITGYLIKIGLVVGYPGKGGELVFQLA